MLYVKYNSRLRLSLIGPRSFWTRQFAKALTTRASDSSKTKTENKKGTGHESFSSARRGSFFQVQPELGNQYKRDVFLSTYLKRHLPSEVST